MKPDKKEKDFPTWEAYQEYLADFEKFEQFYSENGWRRFQDEQQHNMYEPEQADTYKGWLEHERTFTYMGNTCQVENEIIDRIIERMEKHKHDI